MQLGGHLEKSRQNLQAWLHSANSGTTHFASTRWWQSCWKWWVLDVTRSDQPQRINGGAELFLELGFEQLTIQKYKDGAQELGVEAYRMTDATASATSSMFFELSAATHIRPLSIM